MKKKMISILIALCLVLSLFGCGSSGTSSSESPASAIPSEAESSRQTENPLDLGDTHSSLC